VVAGSREGRFHGGEALPGQGAELISVGLGCTGVGMLNVALGFVCGVAAGLLLLQFARDLSYAAENSYYVTVTISVTVRFGRPEWHATYSTAPPGHGGASCT
jgi:hypothetical protein